MIQPTAFGYTPGGRQVEKVVLQNKQGMKAELITYGAIITSIEVPDREGNTENVVAGFDTLAGYLQGHPYFGCVVGRYANRIAGGNFVLEGNVYSLAKNNEGNHLHGGIEGFDKKVWEIVEISDLPAGRVKLHYHSKHLEEGYPGNLDVMLYYSLDEENRLKIDYEAHTDRPTVINLANHSYFNLSAFRNNIYCHELLIRALSYTETGPGSIPTGRILEVKNTPLDFTRFKPIGKDIEEVPPGYDNNYIPDREGAGLEFISEVYEPDSGRVMRVFTTQPGVQLYTGNFLDGSLRGAGGVNYDKHSSFCLETQHFPDAPHHPHFPSTVLLPGEVYRHSTVYAFEVRK